MTRIPNPRALLLLAALLTLIAWRLPFGPLVLYPFTLLATYAHEMGHGLTALLLGADFHSLKMNLDGSGLAEWSGRVGALGKAMIAAGGLVGPSVAGALLLVASRRSEKAPLLLLLLAGLLLASALFFVRNAFGLVFVLATATAFALVARFAQRFAAFFLQLTAVQLCLSAFRDLDYMFSPGAKVGGVLRVSDSAAIADALLLPYWFWGGACALLSFAVLGLGLFVALRGRRV